MSSLLWLLLLLVDVFAVLIRMLMLIFGIYMCSDMLNLVSELKLPLFLESMHTSLTSELLF